MSRIYFHREHGEDLEIWGGERAWMHVLVLRFYLASLGLCMGEHLSEREVDRLVKLLKNSYSHRGSYLEDEYRKAKQDSRRWLSFQRLLAQGLGTPFGRAESIWVAGHVIDQISFQYNSIAALGSSPLVLMARIHDSCELHGYFRAEHWPWLADTIEEGLEVGIMRRWVFGECTACGWMANRSLTDEERKAKRATCQECSGTGDGERHDIGWQGLLELLRESEPCRLVMSYSVCDRFPARYMLGKTEDDPDWEDRRPTWEEGLTWLESRNQELGGWLDISPDSLRMPIGADKLITGFMVHWRAGKEYDEPGPTP
jgi:hypothetical protein